MPRPVVIVESAEEHFRKLGFTGAWHVSELAPWLGMAVQEFKLALRERMQSISE